MELVLVHLTDIHIRDDADFEVLAERIDSIGGAICTHITEPKKTKVLLCITGDFAFEGLENQYTAIGMILEEICEIIWTRYPSVSIHPVFVPGNHDCDFKSEHEDLRKTILDSPTLNIGDPKQFKLCTNIQENFYAFCKEWGEKYDAMYCVNDKVLTINELNFDIEDISLKFHCINTSWCSKVHEEKGKMRITTGKMKMLTDSLPCKESNDIVITMMHHDAEWLDWDDKEEWNNYHKKYSDIILVGHDHAPEFIWRKNYDNTSNYFIKGNQLYDKKNPNQSGFNILKLNTNVNPIQECFFTYEWDGILYKKIIDTGYHVFIRNRFVGNGIELKKEVWDYLEDIEIDIINKYKRDLKLSDVFGFPTLKEEKGKVTRFIRDEKGFMEFVKENQFISIRGQREYGKTALLKQLFKAFYEQKKYPVFLDITKVNTSDGEELNRIVGQKYVETYENVSADEMLQKAPEERVCFIDNFEEIFLSDKTAKKFLQYLTIKFGTVIISCNHKLDLLNSLNYVEMNDFIKNNFSILLIQPARKTYMDRIIIKWLCLEEDGQDIDSLEFDAKKKIKYAEIGNVMQGNYFNGTPVDLLLVLSYLDQEQHTQMNYCKYSFIYDSLILEKLNKIGNHQAQTISAYLKIIQTLAYKMFKENIQGYVDEAFVIGVILDYKEKHSGFTVITGDILQKLVNHSFLECKNDTYRFKYSYMYYYFTGSHIDKNLSRADKEVVTKEIFSNMDNDLNYNVALFLTYSMSIEHDVLPIVKELEERLLEEYKDFKYEDIKELIKKWGSDIEKRIEKKFVVPENENIPILQRERMQKEEEAESESLEEEKKNQEEMEDGETKVPTEEEIREINKSVIKIGRLVDFMGNILKNYAGGMEDIPREEMIDLMFKSVIKIIGSFCSFPMFAVEKLIEMLEEKHEEGDDDSIEIKKDFVDFIKYTFAEIWTQFVSANIRALSGCLECDFIKENMDNYCISNNTDFVKMTRVEFLIRIASTRLPVADIDKLFNGKNSIDIASQNIMKTNIYRYLSNYQYNNDDRRAVCSLLHFNIKDVLVEEQKRKVMKEK